MELLFFQLLGPLVHYCEAGEWDSAVFRSFLWFSFVSAECVLEDRMLRAECFRSSSVLELVAGFRVQSVRSGEYVVV